MNIIVGAATKCAYTCPVGIFLSSSGPVSHFTEPESNNIAALSYIHLVIVII